MKMEMLVVAASASALAAADSPRRPNILFIMSDEHAGRASLIRSTAITLLRHKRLSSDRAIYCRYCIEGACTRLWKSGNSSAKPPQARK